MLLKSKKTDCKNCYKCIRHCRVKSIRFTGNQAHLMEDACILCGECYVVCPQGAKEIQNDIEKAKNILATNEMVIASVAPSFIANYPGVGIEAMSEALKKLGFYLAEETAIGATLVKNEYDYIIDEVKQNIVISSSCSTINLLIQKYYPEVLPFLAKVATPMLAHSLNIKERFPNAKTIFIGPCISKKEEAEKSNGIVDCVLTFEELTKLLSEEEIFFDSISIQNTITKKGKARFFPTPGGILKTMECKSKDYSYLSVDGLDNCISAIQDIASGKINKCFLEMSACTGSCVNGPAIDSKKFSPIMNLISIENFAGNQDFEFTPLEKNKLIQEYPYIGIKIRTPDEKSLNEILKNMGKNKVEDELNCGSCGYNTCREKAVAVYQGKANYGMCLPFLKEKAESFSDTIINNTPNGIIVLNESLEVQQINHSARKIMNIRSESDVMGEAVVRILDPVHFIDVLEFKRNVHWKKVYLAEYKRFVEQTILHDKNNHILICIMKDVTDEEADWDKKERISRQTIETANKVVEKQMRVVQEIASLLGETTAETKIALTRLKELFIDE